MSDEMDDKNKNPAPDKTSTGTPKDGNNQATPPANNGGNGEGTPFKTFSTKEEFDNHSAGIRSSAEKKVEKELLALLGLKPDEKEKLSKIKEAYESTLSEAQKQTEKMSGLENEVQTLKAEIAEKDAIISALSKLNKDFGDISKYVKMAKGLVDENTTMDDAMSQVLSMVKQEKKNVPTGTPPDKGTGKTNTEKNPFKSENLTEQGKAIRMDREQARKWYFEAYGKYPNW